MGCKLASRRYDVNLLFSVHNAQLMPNLGNSNLMLPVERMMTFNRLPQFFRHHMGVDLRC